MCNYLCQVNVVNIGEMIGRVMGR